MSSMQGSRCPSSSDRCAAEVLPAAPQTGRVQKLGKSGHVTDLHVGFTGTRHGVSFHQEMELGKLFLALRRKGRTLVAHHGDCMGADATFYRLARGLGLKVICHPPINKNWRSNLGGDESREELHPLARNAVIVRESTVMIAAPMDLTEQIRGGTWSTIRRARAWGRPLAILWRDGSVTFERWDEK